MDRVKVLAVAGAIVAIVLWAPEPASAQCAMCRRALQSPEGQQMVAAFRSGILVLLAAPFSLVGVIAALVVRMQRARAAAAERPAETYRA
jgi:heme/copper-type cytochrome/quinol oxidase subunit 2